MSELQVNMKKKPDGSWDELHVSFGDHVAVVKVSATSPFVLRFKISAPPEVKIQRK